MFYRKLTLILFTLLIIAYPSLQVKTDPITTNNTEAALAYALSVYNSADDEMDKKWRALDKLEIEYAMLGVQYSDNQQDMIKNAIDLGNSVQVDVLGSVSAIVTAMSKQMIDISDAYSLSVALVNKAIEIESQNVAVATAVSEQGRSHVHYKDHYVAYSKKYSGSKKFIKRGDTPSQLSVGNPGVKCKNPLCDTVYTAGEYGLNNIVSLSENRHRRTCSNEAHTGFSYWHCPDKNGKYPETQTWDSVNGTCPQWEKHIYSCIGGCGNKSGVDLIASQGEHVLATIFIHIFPGCTHVVERKAIRNLYDKQCKAEYYSCRGKFRCPNAENHINWDGTDTREPGVLKPGGFSGNTPSSSGDEQAQNPPTPSTPSTPTLHACGVHATTVSGDHSHKIPACGDDTHAMYACQVGSEHSTVIASCSQTNSHGDTCTVTSYYACQNHTHQYPTRVVCGYSGCDDMVLSRNEHRTTCMHGHYYWTCNTSAVDWHQTRICPKGKWTHQRWNSRTRRYEAVWGVCGESWAKCNWNSCKNMYGAVSYHQQ